MQNSGTVVNSGTVALGGFPGRPAADISGIIDVGVRSLPVRSTVKPVLFLTILLDASATLGAGTTGVARVYDGQQNTSQCSFVCQEHAQLKELPGMQNRTLLLPGLNPSANAIQFFNGYATVGAFSFGNDLLGNTVINVRGKSGLLTRKLLQPAFSHAGLDFCSFRCGCRGRKRTDFALEAFMNPHPSLRLGALVAIRRFLAGTSCREADKEVSCACFKSVLRRTQTKCPSI